MIVLVAIFLLLQAQLWFGEGSVSHKLELDKQWVVQKQSNEELKMRNTLIAKEVESLKTNLNSIEGKARKDLGMIKDGETFYLVIDKKKQLPSVETAP